MWLIREPLFDMHLFLSRELVVFQVIWTREGFTGLRPNITGEAKQTEFSISTYATENQKWHQIKYLIYQMDTSQ